MKKRKMVVTLALVLVSLFSCKTIRPAGSPIVGMRIAGEITRQLFESIDIEYLR